MSSFKRQEAVTTFSRGLESDKDNLKEDTEEDEEEVKNLPKVSHWRLWKKNGKEWPYILVGILCSMLMGGVMPAYGFLFGEILGVLGYTDIERAREKSVTYALYFTIAGLVSGLATFLQVNLSIS